MKFLGKKVKDEKSSYALISFTSIGSVSKLSLIKFVSHDAQLLTGHRVCDTRVYNVGAMVRALI